MADPHTTLVISQHAPYCGTRARAALDVTLAFAAFEQPVSLLLLGAGASQVRKHQDGHLIGRKEHGKLMASLPLYGVEQVYIAAQAAQQYGVDTDNTCLPVILLDDQGVRALIASHQHIVSL